ncbi:hypothetical protein KC317_g18351 [Hortaea werneckii]|nr:hypothetical protein KC317_g18351 [Hortaea werneckii]
MSSTAAYGAVPNPSDNHLARGYGAQDFASGGNPVTSSPLSQSAAQQPTAFHEDFDASQQDSSRVYGCGTSDAVTECYVKEEDQHATIRKRGQQEEHKTKQ